MTLLHMPLRPICKKHNSPKRVTRKGYIYCKLCASEQNKKSYHAKKSQRASLRPYVRELLENFGRIA